jgi:cell wall assembly regulator SMI1
VRNWPERIREAVAAVVPDISRLSAYDRYRDAIPKARPAASERQIAKYEQYLGLHLPPSYRAFLRLHNGYEWLAFPGHMLSIEDVMPEGEYFDDIKEWKTVMAEAGLADALDGIVVAYLDQPNNWAYLDPNRPGADGELDLALHVAGADPSFYPAVDEFIRSAGERAKLALSWAERSAKG